ncbi:MAG: VWA domain-containing protein, partial [Gammaproteobacteria bacterium]|nr:VWA domain-containing protein [Gammaproteobacteria bacterium]
VTAVTVSFFPVLQHAFATPVTSPSIVDPVAIAPISINDLAKNERPKIEVVFVLDTTGSMSGLIEAAKEKIWSIASTMASAQTAPEISMGLVAYRDRGDAYVTQSVTLSSDLDSMYAKLMDFQAAGGGDTPESVNQALFEAVNNMSWSQNQQTYKVIFLVGDAPAHMDYQDDVKYPETMIVAKQKGIIINTIQAGQNNATKTNWQQLAALGNGSYFQVEQTGNAVAISTPYDKKIAKLSAELDATRLYYGNRKEKKMQAAKVAASAKLHKKASRESLARRATYNSSKSGKTNFLGDGELVEAVTNGEVDLSSIATEELPESLQAMTPLEQQANITKTKNDRARIHKEISEIAKQRANYLKKEVAKLGGAKDSFDAKVFGAIRAQAEQKGLIYDDDSARY